MLTLDQLNAASTSEFVALLDGTYEHSPWVAEGAVKHRPLRSLAALKAALVASVRGIGLLNGRCVTAPSATQGECS